MTELDAPLELRIRQIRMEATGIHSYELCAPGHGHLPPFTAGAHIDVHLPGGLVRQYSLSNDPAETHRYVIGVLKDPKGRGGSLRVHEALRVGDTVKVSRPRNQFELRPAQTSALLIAGGIGITPLKSMAHSLLQAGTPFELHYCARSSEVAAFTEELDALNHRAPGSARWHFDNGVVGAGLDLTALLAVQPAGTHLYFCGPPGFMTACAQAVMKPGGPQKYRCVPAGCTASRAVRSSPAPTTPLSKCQRADPGARWFKASSSSVKAATSLERAQ